MMNTKSFAIKRIQYIYVEGVAGENQQFIEMQKNTVVNMLKT